MKKFTLVALAMMASASCFAQKTLWNGEDKKIDADHTSNGFWDRCNPVVVANPDRGGINNTEKCVKFRISGKEWNNGSIGFNLPNGEAGLDVSQCKRFSIMIKKPTNSVVKVQLANGKANYWKNIAANYTGNGEWQKLVFDFSVHSSVFKDNNPVEMAIYPDVDGEDTNEDIYVDNIVLEANPTVGDKSLWYDATKDGLLTGNLKLTGGYFKTTCMNADDNMKELNIDDFAELNNKLSANVTSIDMSEASTIGVDINQFFKNPNTIVYANESYKHANVVVDGKAASLVLTDANAFNAPYEFKAESVKLTRDVQKGINSFVLPFAVTAAELGANQVATYARYDDKDGSKTAYFNPVEKEVVANTPFLTMDVAEDKKAAELSFSDKAIVATPTGSTDLGTDFVGVYAKTDANGKYGINNDGKLQKGGEGAFVNAFHAYLNVKDLARVAFNSSTPTAINGVAADKTVNTAVYDLSGRRVYGKLQKGLYIMNGKKVVVK